jgi:hypothetical protein
MPVKTRGMLRKEKEQGIKVQDVGQEVQETETQENIDKRRIILNENWRQLEQDDKSRQLLNPHSSNRINWNEDGRSSVSAMESGGKRRQSKFPEERVDLRSAQDSVKIGTDVLCSLGEQHRK